MSSVRDKVPRREQDRDAGVLGVDLLSTPGRGLVSRKIATDAATYW